MKFFKNTLLLLLVNGAAINGQPLTAPFCSNGFEADSLSAEALDQMSLVTSIPNPIPGVDIPRVCIPSGEGDERCFYILVPECASEESPLLFDNQGGSICPAVQVLISGFAEKAMEECFVVVWPSYRNDPTILYSCLAMPGGLFLEEFELEADACCCVNSTGGDFFDPAFRTDPEYTSQDPAFLRSIAAYVPSYVAEETNRAVTINTKRIYMTGWSTGCLASHTMAALHSEVVAAVCCFSAASVTPFATDTVSPVPKWTAKGRLDSVFPFAGDGLTLLGGGVTLGFYPSQLGDFDRASEFNGCQSEIILTPLVDDSGETIGTIMTRTDCTNGADVTLVVFDDAGHGTYKDFPIELLSPGDIPLGAETVTGVDTASMAWDFCSSFEKEVAPDFGVPATAVIGAFFSSTNYAAGDPLHPRGSHLYMYYQMGNGKLAGPVGTFETGDAGVNFGSNQGSILVSGNQVFVANGSNNPIGLARNEGSVSVFTFTKYGLTRTANVHSGGPNPASLAICDNILYVANAAYIGGPLIGETLGNFAHPTISSTLTGLKVEGDGTLTYIEALTQDIGVGERAVDIQLTPDSTYLLVAMTAGEVRAYKLGRNCMLTGSFMSNNVDLEGSVALSPVKFDGKNYVYVGNAQTGKVVAFLVDEENESLSFINSAVGPSQGARAALCWTVIYGTYLYTANAGTNTISSFTLDPADGGVELLLEVAAITGTLTFPLDMYVESGRLYQLLGGSGDILVYDIEDDGSLSLLQTFDADLPGGTPADLLPPILADHPNAGPLERPLGLAFGTFEGAATKYIGYVGNNGRPSGAYPLGECQGDCDGSNEECEEGLICFHRDGGEPVPGCLGGASDQSRTDYCVLD
jgi:poly(3-hydroxybutyrate) depolymerase